jgi:O-antigen/teichoic acid export membrane protein
MAFYKKCYLIIGSVITMLGVALMPFLKYLVNLEQPIPENLYLVFFLFVLQSSVSYFFVAYKQTLIEANQKKYKLTKYEVVFGILNCVVDIFVLLIFRDYILYLLFKLALIIVRNLVLAHKIDSLYPYLKEQVTLKLSRQEVKKIFKDVYSVAVFRLGSVLFNSVTNIVTSAVVGTIVVGYYSNYTMIVMQVESIYLIIVSAVAASVGNVVAVESKEKQFAVYKKLNLITFFVYGIACICLFQLLNSFVNLWLGNVGKEYIMSQFVVCLIVANLYTNCSCQVLDRFRTAAGYFKVGRDLQIIGGIVNVFLSVVLAKVWGFEGVLIAPFICKIFITVTPFVLRVGKKVFLRSYAFMLFEYFSQFFVVCFICLATWFLCKSIHCGSIYSFILEVIITMTISILILFVIYHKKTEFLELKAIVKSKK